MIPKQFKNPGTSSTSGIFSVKDFGNEFDNFIKDLLIKRCKLRVEDYHDIIVPNKKLIQQAFTHPSVSDNNYDLFEIIGDGMLEAIVIDYITTTHPKIVDVGWISQIKKYYVSNDFFGKIALRLGFANYIHYSKEVENKIREFERSSNTHRFYCDAFMKIVADVVEAFCGCIKKILDTNTTRGVGYAAVYNFIESFISEESLEINIHNIFDPYSLLKETYEKFYKVTSRSLGNLNKDLIVMELEDFVRDPKFTKERQVPVIADAISQGIRFYGIGYTNVIANVNGVGRTLQIIQPSNSKKQSKLIAAKFLNDIYSKNGIAVTEKDKNPYQRKKFKPEYFICK